MPEDLVPMMRNDDLEAFRLELARDPNILKRYVFDSDFTLITYSAFSGAKRIMEFCLQQGARCRTQDLQSLALFDQSRDGIELLLRYRPHTVMTCIDEVLESALSAGAVSVSALLLQAGACPPEFILEHHGVESDYQRSLKLIEVSLCVYLCSCPYMCSCA